MQPVGARGRLVLPLVVRLIFPFPFGDFQKLLPDTRGGFEPVSNSSAEGFHCASVCGGRDGRSSFGEYVVRFVGRSGRPKEMEK